MQPSQECLLTVDEAATVAEVAPATVRWWMHTGRLPRHRHGRRVYVLEADLLDTEHETRVSGRGRPRGT